MSAKRPTVLSATVLPPVFGPLMTRTGSSPPTRRLTDTGSFERAMPSRSASFGMSSGWRESRSSRSGFGPSTISGGWASMSTARRAIACTASSSPRTEAMSARSSARCPARAVSSCRMRSDLVPLLVLQLHDVVVQLDRGQRLHEEARARARGAVDDPRQLALVLGLQQQHVAVVAGGDDPVLQQPLGVGAAEVALHDARELRPQAQERPADVGELRRGVVGHLARGQDAPGGWPRPRRPCPAPRRPGATGGGCRPPGPPGGRSRPRPR